MLNTILAAQLDVDIKRRDDVKFTVSFADPNDSNNPFDLSQFTTLKMQAANRNNILFTLTLSDGLAVTGAGNEDLTIDISNSRTNILPGDYPYDVEGETAGIKTTILEGRLTVKADVTV